MSDVTKGGNASKKFDAAVFIGRFRPLHKGHMTVLLAALEAADVVIIIVGSANQPRTYRDPFTFAEVVTMIRGSFPADVQNRIFIMPQEDWSYNDVRWAEGIQDNVSEALRLAKLDAKTANITLIGYAKDHTSYYLQMFPQWESLNVQQEYPLNATDLREAMFSSDLGNFLEKVEGIVPPAVHAFLRDFSRSKPYADIMAEYDHVRSYRKAWQHAPYAPIFYTVDACVIRSNHVLLVKRKGFPGRGLYALPGGFLNQYERIIDATIRELIEETLIDVPQEILRGSIVTTRTFDYPHRSSRGRTITSASLIHLQPPTPKSTDPAKMAKLLRLPRVKGSDDAELAVWVPISEITREVMFEDHYEVIQTLLGFLPSRTI